MFNVEVYVSVIGILGIVLNRKSILVILLSIELVFLGVNLNFTTASYVIDDIIGQLFILFILALAAAETSLGLSLSSAYYRIGNSITPNKRLVKQPGF